MKFCVDYAADIPINLSAVKTNYLKYSFSLVGVIEPLCRVLRIITRHETNTDLMPRRLRV